MQRAFADDTESRALCDRLQAMLRAGEPEAALALVRQGLEALADQGLPIVDIALATQPEALRVAGWEAVAATIARAEADGLPITALGIDLTGSCWDGAIPEIGEEVPPCLETNYYNDLPEIAFSTATRAEICAAYSAYGAPWAGNFAEIDGAVEVEGLAKLYSAVVNAKVAGHRDRNDTEGDAYVLAACAAAILLHLAVRRHVAAHGLPKPMALIVGSNEDFPWFDAPVVSVDEARALMADRPAPPPPARPAEPSGRDLRSRLEPSAPEAPPARSLMNRLLGR